MLADQTELKELVTEKDGDSESLSWAKKAESVKNIPQPKNIFVSKSVVGSITSGNVKVSENDVHNGKKAATAVQSESMEDDLSRPYVVEDHPKLAPVRPQVEACGAIQL